jgi:predicted amidohydrolase
MTVIVGYGQFEVAFGDWQRNADQIDRMVKANMRADLLVFPELALSGYDFRDREEVGGHAEPFGEGPTSRLLGSLAASCATTLVAGYAERAGDACYNACLLALPDGTLHNYRKIHLFNREKDLFAPGDAPPPVFDTPAGHVGLMICFDWFFPETARCLALQGAEIIAHPSNLVLPWCQQAMFARSVENRVFTITANRIGTEERAGRSLTFTGGSQVLSPTGRCLVRAGQEEVGAGLADIDPAEADDKRVASLNDLWKDRRPALYSALLTEKERHLP